MTMRMSSPYMFEVSTLSSRNIRKFKIGKDHPMHVNRRNALTFLGLAGTSSAALATEDMLKREQGEHLVTGCGNWNSGKQAVESLKRLIAGIENDEVEVCLISVHSEIRPNTVLEQEFRLTFILKDDDRGA